MRASDHFRLIVDGLPALGTLMTPAGEVELVNRQALEYFGATLEELKGRAIGHSFHPDDRPDVLARWREAVETGHPYDFEARLRRADGVYRWFHTRGFPLRDTEADASSFGTLLHTDVDDRKRAEALLAGEKRLLEMVAGGHSMSEILEALCRLCRKHGQRVLLQRRVGRSERHASRTRSRTEPSGQLHRLHYWPPRKR